MEREDAAPSGGSGLSSHYVSETSAKRKTALYTNSLIGSNGCILQGIAVIGFSIFLIFYLPGGRGGGDLKLMAGFGALLGDGHILWAALFAVLTARAIRDVGQMPAYQA